MSILSWIFKPKSKMAKPNTRRVKIWKYTISSHAQNRIADPSRKLKKKDMLQNLLGRSIQSQEYCKDGKTAQFDRLNRGNRTITHITKKGKVVKSIRKYHKKHEQKEIERLGGKRK